MARFEVITGPVRRRRWSAEQKRAIVAQSLAPGAVVTEICAPGRGWPGPDLSLAAGDRGRKPGFAEGFDRPDRGWRVSCDAGSSSRLRGRLACGSRQRCQPRCSGGGGQSAVGAMIPVPSGVRVWLANAPSAADGSSQRFFCTDRALDRSRMDLQAELTLDQLCQLARPDRLARDQPRPGGRPAPRSGACADHAGPASWGRGRLCLPLRGPPSPGNKVGRETPYSPDVVRGRRLLDRHAPQHLVLHLHDVAWVEESARLELWVADFPGCGIERAQSSGSGHRPLNACCCGFLARQPRRSAEKV